MENTKIQDNTKNLMLFIADRFEKGDLGNDSMVQLIELCGAYINLRTIPQYARESGMSYNGAKKYRKKVELFGVKFIVDNE